MHIYCQSHIEEGSVQKCGSAAVSKQLFQNIHEADFLEELDVFCLNAIRSEVRSGVKGCAVVEVQAGFCADCEPVHVAPCHKCSLLSEQRLPSE